MSRAGRRRNLAEELRGLAVQVQGLVPSHRDPERFHLEKSEVVADIRRLADDVSPHPERRGRAAS